MPLLKGKKALILGVASERSLAWAIARAFHGAGAELALTYAGEALERRVRPLAEGLGVQMVEPCDVTRDDDLQRLFQRLRETWGSLDILVHSVAYALREELRGAFLNTTREGFRVALDVSVYSLVALCREAAPLMEGRDGSVLTLTYYGSEKVVPNYNVMGVAKAALEASVRYLAEDLGPRGVRVNALSAGPVRTLAASGITGFKEMLRIAAERAPLRRNITADEVAQAAVFLASPLASGITGEVLYVDAGYHIKGM